MSRLQSWAVTTAFLAFVGLVGYVVGAIFDWAGMSVAMVSGVYWIVIAAHIVTEENGKEK